MKRLTLLAVCLLTALAPALGQNSTKKIRTKPGPIAAKAGSAVEWRATLDDALAESKESGKPVFWYVPTLNGSFMDRKIEIDRYMMAGPFSWPNAIAVLNEHFVPVKQNASRELCERFDIERVKFIEPGYLVLDGEGAEVMREHHITTFHPQRFLVPLAAVSEAAAPTLATPGAVALDMVDYRDGRWTDLRDAEVDAVIEGDGAETEYLRGALLFHAGRESEAAQVWQTLARTHPEHPLAWKAAAEAEGHGPLVHGFETYDPLPEAALVPSGDGTRAPDGAWTEAQLWERGLGYLRRMQRSDGCFRDSTYDFGGTDGLPNVFSAVTAIVAHAMLESQARLEEPDSRTEEALQLARAYLSDEACINEQDRDERVWAHIYRVRLFARWLELRPGDVNEVRPVLARITQTLADMQDKQGAWYHEYSNPFVSSNALIALFAAREQNIEVTGLDSTISAGMRALLKCRTSDGAYTYGYRAGGNPRADVEGGVGRIPLGELALHLWDSKTGGDLEKAVALSFEHEHYLLPAQKYDDHTRTYAYGGFFFWYDLHGRVEAIAALPAGTARTEAIARQRTQILGLPEFDGCFIDSHEIGRCYGTAMALNCLAILNGVE